MKYAKIFCLTLLLMFTAIVSGCGSSAEKELKTVAVCFPNTTPSWQRNGDSLQGLLEEDGFEVNIQFSATVEEQQTQIKDVIAKNPDCIVIGAIDSAALADVLDGALKKNIPIIAFDRIIMNTDALSYYASFDNYAIGDGMGEYIAAALNLKNGGGPYNIEFFAGGPSDNNAHIFFENTMKILEPYLKSGQLVCRSGQVTFDKVAVADWNSANAKPRINELMEKYYTDAPLQVVLSPNDDIAGVILGEMEKAGKPYPIISGLDGDPAAFERIKQGKQTFTIAKDPDVLTAKCVRMIKAVVEGTQPDINDVTNYNNGVKVVPSYLCTPMIIDKTNVNSLAAK